MQIKGLSSVVVGGLLVTICGIAGARTIGGIAGHTIPGGTADNCMQFEMGGVRNGCGSAQLWAIPIFMDTTAVATKSVTVTGWGSSVDKCISIARDSWGTVTDQSVWKSFSPDAVPMNNSLSLPIIASGGSIVEVQCWLGGQAKVFRVSWAP